VGDITIRAVLHESPHGLVLLGDQHHVERQVTVKLLPAGRENEQEIRRFLIEAATLSRLRHGNIVTLYGVDLFEDRYPYLVMEYIPGQPLDQVLAREGRLEPMYATGIILQIVHALEEAHQKQILHQNLNLQNVLLEHLAGSQQHHVKLINFGLSRWRPVEDRDPMRAFTLTPEEVLGKPYNAASELYVCGVLFYQLLTGAYPYESRNPEELWSEIEAGQPIPLEEMEPSLAAYPELRDVLRLFMCKKPSARFADARHARIALGQLLLQLKDRALGAPRAASNFLVINTVETVNVALGHPAEPSAQRPYRSPNPTIPFAPLPLPAPTQPVTKPTHLLPSAAKRAAKPLGNSDPSPSPYPPDSEDPSQHSWLDGSGPNPVRSLDLDIASLQWSIQDEEHVDRLVDQPYVVLAVVGHRAQLLPDWLRALTPAMINVSPDKALFLVCHAQGAQVQATLARAVEMATSHELQVGVAFGRRLDPQSRRPASNTVRMALRAALQAEPHNLVATHHAVEALHLHRQFHDVDPRARRYSSFMRFRGSRPKPSSP
jgi:serine/threonine protein kinase